MRFLLAWLALDALSLLGLAGMVLYDRKKYPDVRARLKVLR